MTTKRREYRDAVAKAAKDAANKGHYLDRLENIAIAIEDRSSEMAVQALKLLHTYAGCKPQGTDGIQYEISVRLLIKCERDWNFTKAQMNDLWYGVHWDAHKMFEMEFPYRDSMTDEMKADTN